MDTNLVQQLRERVEYLEEELRQIKDEVCPPDNPFVGKLNMTLQLSSLLWVLYSTPGIATIGRLNIVTREHGQRKPKDGSNTTNCTKVRITHLRNRLKKHKIDIKNVWGVGYEMTPDDKQKLWKLLGGE